MCLCQLVHFGYLSGENEKKQEAAPRAQVETLQKRPEVAAIFVLSKLRCAFAQLAQTYRLVLDGFLIPP